jgi:uncharacterized protein YecE (DUF72 family)
LVIYSRNERKPTAFLWYINQDSIVEINASYYGFAMESWINAWLSAAPHNLLFLEFYIIFPVA